jgi:hypothetical protein
MKNAAAWEADFCNHMSQVESSTRVWLDTLAQHTQLQEKQTDGQSPAEVRADTNSAAHPPKNHHDLDVPLAVVLVHTPAVLLLLALAATDRHASP